MRLHAEIKAPAEAGRKAVAHPGRGKPGERLLLPSFEDDTAPSDQSGAAPNRNDLRKLPLLAPLADSKER
jgi:hypothetical protein